MQSAAFVMSGEGTGPGRLALDEIAVAAPHKGEVLVEVRACGVCHTDLHVLNGEVGFPAPAVLGHEVSGIVRGVGPGVEGLEEGQRVACSFIMPCRSCRHCERGNEDLCERFFEDNRLAGRLYDGTTRYSRGEEEVAMYSMGGHSRLCVVPAGGVFPLPDGVDLESAAVLGCSLFTGYGAVHTEGEVGPGDSVAVIAAGGVGLSIIHLACAAGAEHVVAVDVDDAKLELALAMGATHAVNSSEVDPVEEVTRIVGRGVDVAFEALGHKATVAQAIGMLDAGGRAVLAGIAPPDHHIDTQIAATVRRKVKIHGSFGATASVVMPKLIELAAEGRLDLDTLITDRFGFDEIPLAYERLRDRKIAGRGLVVYDG